MKWAVRLYETDQRGFMICNELRCSLHKCVQAFNVWWTNLSRQTDHIRKFLQSLLDEIFLDTQCMPPTFSILNCIITQKYKHLPPGFFLRCCLKCIPATSHMWSLLISQNWTLFCTFKLCVKSFRQTESSAKQVTRKIEVMFEMFWLDPATNLKK